MVFTTIRTSNVICDLEGFLSHGIDAVVCSEISDQKLSRLEVDNMTANQIAFYQAQEARRANLAKEGLEGAKLSESTRHNLQQEGIGYATVGETMRHNQQQEGLDFYKLSNLANLQQAQTDKTRSEVGLGQAQLSETRRHNVNQESVWGAELDEKKRHNVVQEGINIVDTGLKVPEAVARTFRGLLGITSMIGG